MAIEFQLYDEPDGDEIVLSMAPRLESWDAKIAQSQIRLAAYLDHVAEIARVRLGEVGGAPLALELKVALPRVGLNDGGGHDLDNYLYPITRHLGPQRIASARASKSTGAVASTLRIGPAMAGKSPDPIDGWRFASADTTVSTTTAEWKRQIGEQIAITATVAPDGPLELELALAVSSRRDWAALWKPAIDSLGAIVGVVNPLRPFSTRDDRIVRLALHRTIDDSLGNRVRVGVWWRAG